MANDIKVDKIDIFPSKWHMNSFKKKTNLIY